MTPKPKFDLDALLDRLPTSADVGRWRVGRAESPERVLGWLVSREAGEEGQSPRVATVVEAELQQWREVDLLGAKLEEWWPPEGEATTDDDPSDGGGAQ